MVSVDRAVGCGGGSGGDVVPPVNRGMRGGGGRLTAALPVPSARGRCAARGAAELASKVINAGSIPEASHLVTARALRPE